MANAHRVPNHRLAWERLQRGWSHEELRAQLVRAMTAEGETDTGLTRNTVRRWESGERKPEPRYRKYLVVVLGKPADELGLLEPDELALRPAPVMTAVPLPGNGIDTLWRFTTMLDGGAGGIDRETFLKALLAFGAAPLLPTILADEAEADVAPRLARDVPGSGVASLALVEDYEAITARHRAMYWTLGSPLTMQASVQAHVALGEQLLTMGGADHLRRRLAASVADTAMLSGRIAFFDLQRPAAARAGYDVALQATETAGDHAMAAAVLAHLSFVAAHAGDAAQAQAALAAAHAHAIHHTTALTRSWLNAVEAEVAATLHDEATAVRALARAHTVLEDDGRGPDTEPAWFDYYTPARLAGFAGHAQLLLGRRADARPHLVQSLAALKPGEGKQRAVLLADLASTYVEDDLEAACDLTTQALGQLATSWYATGFDRVLGVRRELTPYQQNRQVRELEERVRTVAPGT
jgi:transcriptional regulator with XRE-family HTH domain